MHKNYCYNPRLCSSASTQSGCIARDKSKVIPALTTNFEIVQLRENLLSSGFSCINTRISFHSKMLLPNVTDSKKLSVDESFQAGKKKDLKLIYPLKIWGEETYSDRRILSELMELGGNNQYGFAMTKPLPTGSFKHIEKLPTLKELN